MSSTRILLATSMTFLGLGLTATPQAPDDERIKWLEEAAALARANEDAIFSWEGRVTISAQLEGDWVPGVGDINVDKEERIRFWYDRPWNRVAWTFTLVPVNRVEGGPASGGGQPLLCGAMRTRDQVYRVVWPDALGMGRGPRRPIVEVLERRDDRMGLGSADFHPLAALRQNGILQQEKLEFCALALRRQSQEVVVTRKGSLVSLRQSDSYGSSELTVDLAQGGNAVESWREGLGGNGTTEWQYENHNGVWLPKQIASVSETRHPQFSRVRRVVAFTEQKVNGVLPEDAFTLYNLGLRKGDIVRDARTRAEYEYDEMDVPARAAAASGFTRGWQLTSAALAAALASLVVWRWRQRAARLHLMRGEA